MEIPFKVLEHKEKSVGQFIKHEIKLAFPTILEIDEHKDFLIFTNQNNDVVYIYEMPGDKFTHLDKDDMYYDTACAALFLSCNNI